MAYLLHICDWSTGYFDVRSPSGKQGITFEDNSRFGPSLVNMRTGDLSPVPDKSWFWKFYGPWVKAGRPTEERTFTTPRGEYRRAIWADALSATGEE